MPLFDGLLQPPAVDYKLFQSVDPYGDAVFDQPQITLLQAAGRTNQRAVYNRIVDQLNAERHQYQADGDQLSFQLQAMPPS